MARPTRRTKQPILIAVAGNELRPKNELVKRRTFATRDQARLALFRYIEGFYNPLRRHSSLAMLSPDEYERRYWEDNAAAAAA